MLPMSKSEAGKSGGCVKVLGCLGCLGVLSIAAILVGVFVLVLKMDDPRLSPQTPPRQEPSPPPLPPDEVETLIGKLEGTFRSDSGSAEYILKSGNKEFRLSTKIEGSFFPNTFIENFDLGVVQEEPLVLELAGNDQQAGAHPETVFRIEQRPDGSFELNRVRPFGGTIGIFRPASPAQSLQAFQEPASASVPSEQPESPSLASSSRMVSSASPPETPESSNSPASEEEALIGKLEGEFLSTSGKASYILRITNKEDFLFSTRLDGQFHLENSGGTTRTRALFEGFNLKVVQEEPLVVELTGDDRRTGGDADTTYQFAMKTDGTIELRRLQPQGTWIGTFRRIE